MRYYQKDRGRENKTVSKWNEKIGGSSNYHKSSGRDGTRVEKIACIYASHKTTSVCLLQAWPVLSFSFGLSFAHS